MTIFTVLGACSALSFGCASLHKIETQALDLVKQEQKTGNIGKLVTAINKTVDKADDKKSDKGDAKDSTKKPSTSAKDKELEKAVTDAVGHGFRASAKDGVVTLSGQGTAKDKTAAEVAAKRVKGVSKVINDIEVKK